MADRLIVTTGTGGVGSIYDRFEYSEENKKVMESVAARILSFG